MSFIYPDHPEPMTRPFRAGDYNATNQYLKHFSNVLILTLFYQRGTVLEKIQAAKELKTAERKMEFWSKQDNFSQDAAILGMAKYKKQWVENDNSNTNKPS